MVRILAVIMSAIISLIGSFSAAFSGAAAEAVKAAVALMTEQRVLTETDDADIVRVSDNAGYLKNALIIIFSEDADLFDRISAVRKCKGTVLGYLPEARLSLVAVRCDDYEELIALADEITALDSVEIATVCPVFKYSPDYTPNDPFRNDDDLYTLNTWDEDDPSGNNWWLEAIDARGAWGYDCYFNDIKLGIVDSGFDIDHPDLKDKITLANRKAVRRNRSDDHGNHVAGIIGAIRDNSVGISGITPTAQLIVTDWHAEDDQKWINDVAIFFGFGDVVKAGAKVINFSVGASGSIKSGETDGNAFLDYWEGVLFSYYMSSLLHRGYDFIAVQSAGNGNSDGDAIDAKWNGNFCSINKRSALIPFFDVKYEDLENRIIVVGNSREPDYRGVYRQSSSSNVGETVDICAPGTSLFSTYPDGRYGFMSGTSMAAPVVTAVAGLVWSAVPELKGDQVRDIVLNNSKDIVQPTTNTVFENVDYKAYPLVNAKLSVEAALKEYRSAVDTVIDFNDVPFDVCPAVGQSVVVEHACGRQFIFEVDSSFSVSCVLSSGPYTVYDLDHNVIKSFEVS